MRFTLFEIQEWHCFRHVKGDLSRVSVASVIGRLSHQPEKSNGAGKSYFIESVLYALFGYDREPPDIQRNKATADTFVEWHFEHRGQAARVKRGFRIKRDGSKGAGILEFEIDGLPQGKKVAEIEAAIEAFVGCSLDIYRATSFFTQGDADQFAKGTPAKRKEILHDLLGLSMYERARVIAEREIAVLRASVDDAERRAGVARLSLEEARKQVDVLMSSDLDGALARQEKVIEALVALQADYPASLSNVRSFTEAIPVLTREVASRRAAVETAEADVLTASSGSSGLEAAERRKTARHRALADEYRVRQEKIRRIPELKEAADKAKADLAAASSEYEEIRVDDLKPWQTVGESAVGAIAAADLVMKDAEASIRRIDTLGATCVTCRQGIPDAYKAGRRAEEVARHEAAGKDRAEAMKNRTRAWAEQERIQGLIERRHAVALRIASLKPQVTSTAAALAEAQGASEDHAAAVQTAQDEMARLDADIASARAALASKRAALDAARGAYAAAAEALTVARGSIDEGAEPAVARLHSRIVARYKEALVARDRIVDQQRALEASRTRFEEGQRVLFEVERDTRAARARMDSLAFLAKAFSKNGIPHLVSENVVAEIERGTVEILRALESPNRIVFRTATETGQDTIQIEVETPDGKRGVRSFSGGQVTEQNLAIRLALGEVLARRAEVSFRSVFLDEVMAALDAPARQCFIRVVNLMRRSFSQILVISHHSEIRDFLESRIAVEWHPDGATVEISA